LSQARQARIEILRKMLSAISRPREEISNWAPRLIRTNIEPDKIGALIGPGGKNIRGIQETTGTVIEVDDDGTVTIAANDRKWAEEALRQVESLTATVQVGKIYDGKVTSIKDFGAFVEILPGRDGLCHISELSSGFVSSVNDVCRVGDPMKVLVIAIDEHDRVKLSRRRALEQLGLPDELASSDDRHENEDGEVLREGRSRGDGNRGEQSHGDWGGDRSRGDRGRGDRGRGDRGRGDRGRGDRGRGDRGRGDRD